MSLYNRQTLKNFFKKGQFPTEVHFKYLIDSTVNKIDDGFAKSEKEGLQLAPVGDSKKVLSVFEQISSPEALWQFQLEKEGSNRGLNIALNGKQSQLFFDDGGNLGIQTKNPAYTLEVNGTIAYKSRIGVFQKGSVFADGKWHTILSTDQIEDLGTYEINARVRKAHQKDKS